MAWLEDYDPTPAPTYTMEMEPGPPSLRRALAMLALFLLFAATVWWMATALNSSLPAGPDTVMVQRGSFSAEGTKETKEPPSMAAPEKEGGPAAVEEEQSPLTSSKSSLTEADRHFLKASKLYDAKDYKKTAEELRLGLTKEPDNATQRALLAMVLSYEKEWTQSAEEYKKALQREPDNALLHLGLAVAYHRQEKITEAIDSLEKAVALDPSLEEADKMLELLTREPQGAIEKVWLEHNVNVNGWDGLWVHTACTANYWSGREGVIRATFFYEDGGEVSGSYSNMVLSSGQASIEGPFKPPHRKTRYKDLHLFFPYKGLRLAEGEYNLKIKLELVGPERRVLDTRWASMRLEVIKTAYSGAIEQARSSSSPQTSTQ